MYWWFPLVNCRGCLGAEAHCSASQERARQRVTSLGKVKAQNSQCRFHWTPITSSLWWSRKPLRGSTLSRGCLYWKKPVTCFFKNIYLCIWPGKNLFGLGNQSYLKEISPDYHWKDWCQSWNSSTLATWYKELTHWKRPWCWDRLKAGGEGDDRGWDGWMTSLTRWTWVWASSESWWWIGKPSVLSPWCHKESDVTEQLNWTDLFGFPGS